MIYGDHPKIRQKDYDKYYIERYGFGVEDMEARGRQKDHAIWLNNAVKDKEALIVDFGGAGIIKNRLNEYGFKNVYNVTAGEALPDNVDVIFAEHVLEHIYDLPDAMRRISKAVRTGGMLIVDGPESTGMIDTKKTPMLDWHQKHINHFKFLDYLNLMRRYGFEFVGAVNYIERKGTCIHLLFGKAELNRVYEQSVEYITKNMNDLVLKLYDLKDREVIVWGCWDIALHTLACHMPNVKYFVDKDPAFKGAVIAGKKVLDSVQEGDTTPIVVIAQGQKQDIIMNIKKDNLINEVITL